MTMIEQQIERHREELNERERERYRAWLDQRRTALCSTDSAKILGLSKWGSPRSVYLSKVDPVPEIPPEASLAAWLGRQLETTVAARFTHETGLRTRRSQRFWRMPGRPHIGGHVDFTIPGKKALLETKTRGDRKGWGPDHSSVVPADVWIQCQHEMLITNMRHITVAVLFGNRSFAMFHLQRDDGFLGKLVPRLDAFWGEHVLPQKPPEATWIDASLIDDQYPDETPGLMRTATPELDELILRYRDAVDVLLDKAHEVDTYKARLKEVIGPASGLQGINGTITWKADHPNPIIEHDAYAAALELLALEHGAEQDELERLRLEHTSTRQPRRVFLLKEVQAG